MTKKPKFYFEIDCGGTEAVGYEDRYSWVCYGTIVAEGDTLEELLENASVDLVDQDGGEAAIVEAETPYLQSLIRNRYEQEVNPVWPAGEPEDTQER